MTPAALLCALLASGPGYDLGLRLEARRAQAGTPTSALELEIAPSFSIHTQPGDLTAAFTYAPRLIVDELTGQPLIATLHTLRAAETISLRPNARLLLEQHLAFGETVFSLLQQQSGPLLTPERLPVSGSLPTLDWGGSATLTSALTRRLTAAVSAAYNVSGGLDASARAALPLQHGVSARALLDWAASRLDSLQVAMSSSAASLAPGQVSEIFGATSSWHTRLASDSVADASAGLNLSHSTVRGGAPDSLSPVASAGLTLGLSERSLPGSISLKAALTSAVDPLTIRVYQRAEARAALELLPQPGVKISLRGFVAKAFGSISGTIGEGEAGVSLRLTPPLSVTFGARLAWLSQGLAPPGLDSFQWTAFAGLTALQAGEF